MDVEKGQSFQAKSDNFECDEKPSILCLAKGYSTFDLPFRQKPNLIKIGRWEGGVGGRH